MMRKPVVFLTALTLTATVLVQTSFSRSVLPRFWSPITFGKAEDSRFADSPSSARDSSISVDFGPNSGVFTHPFFSNLVPGVGVHFTGYGHEDGFWWSATVRSRGYFKGIHCLIAEHRNDELEPGGYHVLIYNAEALNGGQYRIAEQLWQGDDLIATEDYSANPGLVYPASLDQVGLSWDSSTVTAVNYTVPENEHGMGPYAGCVVVRFDWGDGDYDYTYIAPGIGEVWDQWDDSGAGGYRISSFSTSEPTWTPTPTGTFAPTSTPTASPAPLYLNEETWITDGNVKAIVRSTETVYIGGYFSYVGPYTGSGVPIDPVTGSPVAQFPKVNGFVYGCVADRSGGWYIGGDFDRVGTLSVSGLAHILSDGSVDPAWAPKPNDPVSALALSDDGGTLYAGGWFTSIGGQARNHLAAFDASTGAATPWDPAPNGSVSALAVSGLTVYAGGSFTTIAGEARICLAALDAVTGNATAWNPGPDASMLGLAVSEDCSTVYAAGNFSTIGGQARFRLAALDAVTGNATAWDPGANGVVEELAVSGSTVYVGGGFTSIGGADAEQSGRVRRFHGCCHGLGPSAERRR